MLAALIHLKKIVVDETTTAQIARAHSTRSIFRFYASTCAAPRECHADLRADLKLRRITHDDAVIPGNNTVAALQHAGRIERSHS